MAKARKVRKASNIPADETKEARFIRLARPRVNRAIKSIDSIGKLSAAQYNYTAEQVQKIGDALRNALTNCMARMERSKETKTDFIL